MELNDVTNGNEISKNSQRIMFEDGDINISESKESDYFSNDKNDQRFPETKAQISYPGSQINIAKKHLSTQDQNFSRFSIRQAALFQSANMNQLDKVFPDSNFAPSNPDLNMDKKPTVNHLMSEASKEGEKDEEADQDFEGMISIKFKKTFLFYQESRFRIRWDLLVMFVAVYNCFDVPYNVAFTDKNHQPLYSTILDALTNLLFILDLLINFVTTYTDKATKVEVTSYSKIAKHYLKGKFWIDLIASIPFDYIRYLDPSSNTIPFELLSLLKLVRILRLSKLITYMNIRNEVKSSLRLIKLVFFLILFLHCLGCFWFFLAKQTEKWIPPLDYVYITTTIYSESSVFQYCSAIYHAVLLLGGNDIGPRGEYELVFTCLALCICAITNAIIFGNFAVMLQAMNRKSTQFQEKLETTTDVMKNMNLNENVKSQIKHFMEYTDTHLQSQNEMNDFFQILSPSLKKKVMTNMFKDCLMTNDVLEKKEDLVTLLCEKLEIKVCVPEENIVIQGDEADSMFFCARGSLNVLVADEFQKFSLANTISTGSYFGEVALLKDCKRTATVTSSNYGTLGELSRNDFDALLGNVPSIKSLMNDHIHSTYNDKWRKFMHRALRSIDYLTTGVSNRVINELSYQFEYITLEEGRYLFQAGEICDSIYVVCSGELNIFIKNTNKESYIDTLYTGCTLGGYGCLNSELYTSSARAKSECVIMRCRIEKIQNLRKDHNSLNLMMVEYENYIDHTPPPVCDYKLYRYKLYKMSIKKRLLLGISRLNRIIRSTQTYEIRELLHQAKVKAQMKHDHSETIRKNNILRRVPANDTQRNEKALLSLHVKIDKMADVIDVQK